MTRPVAPSLDPEIDRQEVDPDKFVQWFSFLGDDAYYYPAVLHLSYTAEGVLALCGSSRSRTKAGAAMVSLLASRAASWGAITDENISALGVVLGLNDRKLAKRVSTTQHHYADHWLAGDEDRIDGPSRAEIVALKIIAAIGSSGVTVGARLASYDLIDWYRQHQLPPSPVVINALAAVVGLVDANTGRLNSPLMKLLVGGNPERLRKHALFDAAAVVGLVDLVVKPEDPAAVVNPEEAAADAAAVAWIVDDGLLTPSFMGLLTGSDPERLRNDKVYRAVAKAVGTSRPLSKEHNKQFGGGSEDVEVERSVRSLRQSPAYGNIESQAVQQMTGRRRFNDHAEGSAEQIYRRYNAPKSEQPK